MEFLPQIVITVLSVVLIPLIVQGIKIWRNKANPEVGLQKKVVTILSFVLSIVAAVIWAGVILPPFAGDPLAYIQSLLTIASVFFTAVKGVYDFILKSIFEQLGWV